MDAILLLAEAVGALIVMRWVARGDGEHGWPAWKPAPPARPGTPASTAKRRRDS